MPQLVPKVELLLADRKHENDQQPSQVDSPAEMTVDPTPQRREEDENPKVFQHLIQRQITPAPITGIEFSAETRANTTRNSGAWSCQGMM